MSALRAALRRLLHHTQSRIRRVYESPGPNHSLYTRYAAELIESGVVLIPCLFGGHTLSRARFAFDRHIANVTPECEGKYAFHREHAVDFADMIQHPTLLDTARRYWRQDVIVTEFHGYRLLPKAPDWTDVEQWHVEGRGKELRAMILLTDVGPDDQCLEIIPHTHTVWRESGEKVSAIEATRLAVSNGIVRGTGLAGSVVMWDSNGIHRGTRTATGNARDVLLPRYVGASPLRWLTGGPRRERLF